MTITALGTVKLPKSKTLIWTVYRNQQLWLISMKLKDSDWITFYDRNLWVDEIWWSWYFFQWWNNYAFDPNTVSEKVRNQQIDPSWYWPDNPLIEPVLKYDTYIVSVNNTNMWWWDEDDVSKKRWPCPEWYHIPTKEDIDIWTWMNEYLTWEEFRSIFLIEDTAPNWSCSYESIYQEHINFWSSNWVYEDWRCYGSWISTGGSNAKNIKRERRLTCLTYYIRPFKDTPIVPDSSREIIYKLEI